MVTTEPLTVVARLRRSLALLGFLPRTARIVWASSRGYALALVAVLAVAAALPACSAWIGKLIVDAVVAAARSGAAADKARVLNLILLELGLMVTSTALTQVQSLLRQLLGATLGNRVNTMILEKAVTLELRHFEDADFYDKMQNARREATSRPLSLVMEVVSLAQQLLVLTSYAVILSRLSWWSVLVILLASLPAFIAETRMSREAFRLNSWRAAEARRHNYLEWILTRDSHVKEVKVFDIGGLILGRYRAPDFVPDRLMKLRVS